MPHAVALLALVLVTRCSDALNVEGHPTKKTISPSQTNVLRPKDESLIELNHTDNGMILTDPVLVRPNAGKGVDTVAFGLMIMNFFGDDLKRHTFSVDMLMSARWNDPRVIGLIPEGQDQLSIAWRQAVKLLWMPGIVVTNRDIEKYEIVSASVTVFRSGEVLRVERAQARIMMKFKLQDFPFDSQQLAVKIASSKYMLDEVVLVPEKDENVSGVHEKGTWGLYELQGWHTEAYESRDGILEKSRGVLTIDVKRTISNYFEDHLVPSFITITISWAVFYFPFAGPFITPRLALSILALLTFTNLMVKSSKALPGAAPFNWNDLFNQQIQALMFVTILINIGSEIAHHQLKNENLARMLNNEAKILMPSLSVINIVIILCGGLYKWMTLGIAGAVTKMIMVLFLIIYCGIVGNRVYRHVKAGPLEEKV